MAAGARSRPRPLNAGSLSLMSHVTNIVLSVDGDDVNLIDQVNSFIDRGRGFVSVGDESLPTGWYGGTKALEADLYIGALITSTFLAFWSICGASHGRSRAPSSCFCAISVMRGSG